MEPLSFYREIESKNCNHCGEKIEEQGECYGNVCNDCILEDK